MDPLDYARPRRHRRWLDRWTWQDAVWLLVLVAGILTPFACFAWFVLDGTSRQ